MAGNQPRRDELGANPSRQESSTAGEQGRSETLLGPQNSKDEGTVIESDDFLDADEYEQRLTHLIQTQQEILATLSQNVTPSHVLAVSRPKTAPSGAVVFLMDARDLNEDSVLGVTPADSTTDLSEIIESEQLIYNHLRAASENFAPADRPKTAPAKTQTQVANLHGRPTADQLQRLLISAEARAVEIKRQLDLVRQQRQAQAQPQVQQIQIQSHTSNIRPHISTHISLAAQIIEASHHDIHGSAQPTQSKIQSRPVSVVQSQRVQEYRSVAASSIHNTASRQVTDESQNVLGTAPSVRSNIQSRPVSAVNQTQMSVAASSTHNTESRQITTAQGTQSNIQSRPVSVVQSQQVHTNMPSTTHNTESRQITTAQGTQSNIQSRPVSVVQSQQVHTNMPSTTHNTESRQITTAQGTQSNIQSRPVSVVQSQQVGARRSVAFSSAHTTVGGNTREESQDGLGTAHGTLSNIQSRPASAVESQQRPNTTQSTGSRQIEQGSQNVLGTAQGTRSNIQSRPVSVVQSQQVQGQGGGNVAGLSHQISTQSRPGLTEQRSVAQTGTGVTGSITASMIQNTFIEDNLTRVASALAAQAVCPKADMSRTNEAQPVKSSTHANPSNIQSQYSSMQQQQQQQQQVECESDDALNRRVSGLIQPILAEQKNEVQRETSVAQFNTESAEDEAFVEDSLSRVASNLAVQSIYCIDVQSAICEEDKEVEELLKAISLVESQQQSQIMSRRASIEQQLSQYQFYEGQPSESGVGALSHMVSDLIRPVISEQRGEVQREIDVAFLDEASVTESDFGEDNLTRVASALARNAIGAMNDSRKD